VDDPFDQLRFFSEPNKPTQVDAIVHFLNPVKQADLANAMLVFNQSSVAPVDGEADPAKSYKISGDMNPTVTTKEGVIAELSLASKGLKDTEGRPVELSSPIPEAELVGKRAADDLTESAAQALLLALGMIILYVRVRFHEYKYGIGAVCSLLHDVLIAMGAVVLAHAIGVVNVEIDLALVAVFLTVIGYSVNDTIVVFDRLRENLLVNEQLGTRETYESVMNRAINQTFTRTIWTSATTIVVVLCQFLLNWGTGSPLEGFAFPMIIGLITGSYSTIMIAAPVALWIHNRAAGQADTKGGSGTAGGASSSDKAPKKAAVHPA
jgi:preprotein translocase SecF subunit